MKIVVLDFSSGTEIDNRISKDIEIHRESIDGGRAYTLIGEVMPDFVFINYSTKPSHGLQTAIAVRKRKKTSQIPILFISDTSEHYPKVRELGDILTFDQIEAYLMAAKT